MSGELDAEIRQNTRDISTLSQQVIRVVTMVENSEKRHDDEKQVIQEIFTQIKAVNEKIGATVGMKDDISALREDIRVARHDLDNVKNGLQGLAILNEKVVDLKGDTGEKINELKNQIVVERSRIDGLITRNANIDGGVKAIRWGAGLLWTVFGGGITAIGVWLFSSYFQHVPGSVTQTYQSKQVISGE